MMQIAQRLVADMRWRLSPAGKRYSPSRSEIQSWGSAPIPWMGSLFGGCAGQAVALGLAITAFDANFIIGGFLSVLLFFAIFPMAFIWRAKLQVRQDLAAYARLVKQNERFALVEYGRLLQRQIVAAQADPRLGGTAELTRLRELQSKIQQLIQDGAGLDGKQAPTALASEADLAASIVEAYSIGKDDGLAELDSRLPTELRSRLDEVDAEAGRLGNREKSETG